MRSVASVATHSCARQVIAKEEAGPSSGCAGFGTTSLGDRGGGWSRPRWDPHTDVVPSAARDLLLFVIGPARQRSKRGSLTRLRRIRDDIVGWPGAVCGQGCWNSRIHVIPSAARDLLLFVIGLARQRSRSRSLTRLRRIRDDIHDPRQGGRRVDDRQRQCRSRTRAGSGDQSSTRMPARAKMSSVRRVSCSQSMS